MKVIAFIDLAGGKAMADLAPHREAESRALWELMKAGRVRAAHYRETMTGAVLELEAATTAEAREWLSDLPAVKAGVLQITDAVGLLPYTGYELLFAQPA